MDVLNYFRKLRQRFAEEPKGIVYYAGNLSSLFFAASLFFSGLYGIQDSIIYFISIHISIHDESSHDIVRFGPLVGPGIEQSIISLIETLRYHFWIFFCLLLRHMVLLNRNWWSFLMRFLWLIAAVVFVILYMSWAVRLNKETFMSPVQHWVFNGLFLSLFVPFVWDVVIITYILLGKPFDKSKSEQKFVS